MAVIGNSATQQAFTPAVDYFSGNGSTTAFTLSRPVASVAQVEAVIDNVVQNPSSAYTVSGNTITFTSAPLSGTNNIYVRYTSPITQVIAPGQGTVNIAAFNATGTPSSSTYLRGDNTWSAVSGGVTSAVAGTGISVSGATGAVTFTNTGVTSITGTASQVTASASTGGVTLSLPATINVNTSGSAASLSSTLAVSSGGTGLTATPTNGQIDIGNGTGFTRTTLTAGTGISVTNGAGSITIATSGSSGVTSVATGNGLQGGTITTTGTLSVAAPSYNSVGSYVIARLNSTTISSGGSYAAGGGSGQIQAGVTGTGAITNNLSGTWRHMGANFTCGCLPSGMVNLFVRVS